MRRNRTLIAATTLAGVLALSGCQSDGPDEIPDVPTPTGSASADRPAWYDDYSAEQIKAYEEAVSFAATTDRAIEPLFDDPQPSPEVESTLQRYRSDWFLVLRQLKDFQAAGITSTGRAEVLWSEPVEVAIAEAGDVFVKIRQCVDSSAIKSVQNGQPLSVPDPATNERIVEVRTSSDGTSLMSTPTSTAEVIPCEG